MVTSEHAQADFSSADKKGSTFRMVCVRRIIIIVIVITHNAIIIIVVIIIIITHNAIIIIIIITNIAKKSSYLTLRCSFIKSICHGASKSNSFLSGNFSSNSSCRCSSTSSVMVSTFFAFCLTLKENLVQKKVDSLVTGHLRATRGDHKGKMLAY